jgi:hypothetical protein
MICACTLAWAANDKMNEVSIRWPNGETEILRDVPADFIYTVVEGFGQPGAAGMYITLL